MGLPFGDLCPQGHYCPAGTTHPKEMPCPAGTWNGQRGAQDATWCLPCAPGFFCNMSGQDAPAGFCARGETKPELLLLLRNLGFFEWETGLKCFLL